jgi:hypothetical protein
VSAAPNPALSLHKRMPACNLHLGRLPSMQPFQNGPTIAGGTLQKRLPQELRGTLHSALSHRSNRRILMPKLEQCRWFE